MDTRQVTALIAAAAFFIWSLLWVTIGAVVGGEAMWPFTAWITLPVSGLVYMIATEA